MHRDLTIVGSKEAQINVARVERLFVWLEPMTTRSYGQQPFHCAEA